ncbi:MAG TPA: cyclase family protein [Granulicella sp.]
MRILRTLILLGSAVAVPMSIAQTASAAKPREHYTKAQFDALFQQLSNWGRWGKDDQIGTLNLITPERRRTAAEQVREGISVSLARELNTVKGIDNPTPFQDTMSLGVDGKFNMDTYTVNFHGFASSHFDALSHTYYEGKLYNGYADSRITASGAEVLDTVQYGSGIFTRGVLVDIPWLRGLPYLEATASITADDMDAWEKKTGTHIGPGDAVVIRTGRWALRDAKGPWDIANAEAGLDPSVMTWLKRRDVAMLVSDDAHDAIPSAVEDVDFPIHILAIVAMGMPLADQCNLEDIAKTAQALHRQTFLLIMAPVKIKGGTGALINPIATF